MRTDPGKAEFHGEDSSKKWEAQDAENKRGRSFSGHERNRLFFSNLGKEFVDISGVSGLDHVGDSRCFAVFDYDHDGWQDIAVVNANAPLLQVFRNQLGEFAGDTSAGVLAIRFVGGNHTPFPNVKWTNRDGYGTKVVIELDELTLLREYRAGEGFAAQNSATMIVGIGKSKVVRSVTVQWPSGIVQKTENVGVGTLLTVYERPSHAPQGRAFLVERYNSISQHLTPRPEPLADEETLRLFSAGKGDHLPRLSMYTAVATWCTACQKKLPQYQRLRKRFDENELGIYGIPVSATDDNKKLRAFMVRHRPAYTLLFRLSEEQITSFKEVARARLGAEVLPTTILTDNSGHVVYADVGVPTVSLVRKLLASLR